MARVEEARRPALGLLAVLELGARDRHLVAAVGRRLGHRSQLARPSPRCAATGRRARSGRARADRPPWPPAARPRARRRRRGRGCRRRSPRCHPRPCPARPRTPPGARPAGDARRAAARKASSPPPTSSRMRNHGAPPPPRSPPPLARAGVRRTAPGRPSCAVRRTKSSSTAAGPAPRFSCSAAVASAAAISRGSLVEIGAEAAADDDAVRAPASPVACGSACGDLVRRARRRGQDGDEDRVA